MSICDDCKYCDRQCDESPCCVCMQWVDGYLEATRYEPLGMEV